MNPHSKIALDVNEYRTKQTKKTGPFPAFTCRCREKLPFGEFNLSVSVIDFEARGEELFGHNQLK
jgi:hypothetical protein